MWSRLPAVALLLLALALAACGDDDGGGDTAKTQSEQAAGPAPTGTDEQQIQETWRRYYTALSDGDGTAVCALLTENGRKEVVEESSDSGGTCEEIVAVLGPFFKDYDSKLTDVEIKGDTATAVAPRSGDIQAQGIEFKRDGGSWKIDSSKPA